MGKLTSAIVIEEIACYDKDFIAEKNIETLINEAIKANPREPDYLSRVLEQSVGHLYSNGDIYEIAKNIANSHGL